METGKRGHGNRGNEVMETGEMRSWKQGK